MSLSYDGDPVDLRGNVGTLDLLIVTRKLMLRFLLSCTLLLSSHSALAFSYTMEIPENEIQQKVAAMMPIQKTKFLMTVVLSDPKVSLIQESNEVAVSSPIDITAPAGINGSGFVKIQGSVSYDAKSGEFFLRNPTIIEFEVKGLPAKYQSQIKLVVQSALESALATRPIYKLKDDNLKQKFTKAILKSVTVKGRKLLIELGAF